MTPVINNNRVQGVLFAARDITDLKSSSEKLDALNKSLLENNNQLEERNRELASFNYIASHDLKEPLRKIQMFSDRLMDIERSRLSEESWKHLIRIHQSAAHLQDLIDALLDYSRTGGNDSSFEDVDLKLILEGVLIELKESINERKAVIRFTNLPVIKAIPYQIRQLLWNLVSNALKYSKEDAAPVIDIAAMKISSGIMQETGRSRYEYFWKISVTDNGIGFDQEYSEKIFELFQRLHDKDRYPGTGIGLAICKKIVQNHNGVIRVMSRRDKGSTFEVYLPEINFTI
jgi:light-regulated signal transduction histidine kinase (bacteriophytochrome)